MQIKLNINGILFVTFSLLQNSIQVILIHYISFLHTNHIYISLLEDTKLCSVRQCKTSQHTLILSPTAYMYDKCTQVGNLKFLSKNFNFIHIVFKSLAITCTLYHNNAILSYFFNLKWQGCNILNNFLKCMKSPTVSSCILMILSSEESRSDTFSL